MLQICPGCCDTGDPLPEKVQFGELCPACADPLFSEVAGFEPAPPPVRKYDYFLAPEEREARGMDPDPSGWREPGGPSGL